MHDRRTNQSGLFWHSYTLIYWIGELNLLLKSVEVV